MKNCDFSSSIKYSPNCRSLRRANEGFRAWVNQCTHHTIATTMFPKLPDTQHEKKVLDSRVVLVLREPLYFTCVIMVPNRVFSSRRLHSDLQDKLQTRHTIANQAIRPTTSDRTGRLAIIVRRKNHTTNKEKSAKKERNRAFQELSSS